MKKFNCSPDFQITIDDEGKIMWVNQAWEEITGKKREELIDGFVYHFISKEGIKKIKDKILKEKKVKNIEITLNIPKREPIICDFSGAIFTDLQGKTGIYLSGRDITKRIKLTQNLKELSENLEKKVIESTKELREVQEQVIQLKKLSITGQLEVSVAHEIRNSLTLMSLTIQNLVRKNYNDFQKAKLQNIKKNIDHINEIVQELLTFYRPFGSAFTYRNINEILYKLEPTIKNIFPKNIKINKDYNMIIPKLWFNSNRLEQVFINLILNAMQAIKERGALYISTDYDSKRKGILIKFKDTGCGIAKENLKKVFNPFFTTYKDGNGLGLPICQMIINEHKGNISVESKIGKGTVFTIFLPIEKRKVKQKNE